MRLYTFRTLCHHGPMFFRIRPVRGERAFPSTEMPSISSRAKDVMVVTIHSDGLSYVHPTGTDSAYMTPCQSLALSMEASSKEQTGGRSKPQTVGAGV